MADTTVINMGREDSINLLHQYYMDYSHLSTKKTTFYMPKIKKVIFNDPATIVLWSDNTKTVVKAENEAFDKEKGLAMAISKKALGNQGNYFEEFKKWVNYDEKEPECKSETEFLNEALSKIADAANKVFLIPNGGK